MQHNLMAHFIIKSGEQYKLTKSLDIYVLGNFIEFEALLTKRKKQMYTIRFLANCIVYGSFLLNFYSILFHFLIYF